ncbi:MAG: hypothetical protein M0037_06420 [Betaproteobacteria bacterium]|nr:hypothetical protein [Betaproteobacteria bacterium]
MELAAEDVFCLQVMLASGVQAIRVDESALCVYALTQKGEARVALHPQGNVERYLRLVRELLVEHAMESGQGYRERPRRRSQVFHIASANLEPLLLTGDAQALSSVARSARLTDELAARVWWAMPTADHARRMLERECVAHGQTGKALAEFLIGDLPFESDAEIVESLVILLRSGLVEEAQRMALWKKGAHKPVYYLPFLAVTPDDLPCPRAARPDWETLCGQGVAHGGGDGRMRRLCRVLSGNGQAFLQACVFVLTHADEQDLVTAVLDALSRYLQLPDDAEEPADPSCEGAAMRALSRIGPWRMCEFLPDSSISGTLMRSRLKPLTDEVLGHINVLLGRPTAPA